MKRFIAAVNGSRKLLFVNVVAFFFLVNAVGSQLGLRLDLTRDQINSLTESTEKVLSSVDDRILVEAYISQDLPGQAQVLLEPIRAQLQEIKRVGGDRVQLRMISPDDEETRAQAERRGVRGVRIGQTRVDQSTVKLGFFGIYLQIGDKSKVIPLISEESQGIVQDFEYRFLREVKKLTRPDRQSAIAFVTGPGLFSLQRPQRGQGVNKDGMFFFKYLLEQEEGPLRTITLEKEIPSDVTTLVFAGLPEFSPLELYNFDQYLLRGGNAMLLLQGLRFNLPRKNPMMQRFNLPGQGNAFATVPKQKVARLNEWLGGYGLSVNPEILIELEAFTPTYDLGGEFFQQFRNPVWALYTDKRNLPSEHPALADLNAVVFPWVSGLDIKSAKQSGARFEVLVQSTSGAISKQTLNLSPRNLHQLQPQAGEQRTGRPVPVAVLAEGKFQSIFARENLPPEIDAARFRAGQAANTESRLIVMGSAYVVSDVLLQRAENAEVFRFNQIFLTNLLEAVSGDTDLLAARSRVRSPEVLENLGPGFEEVFKWFHILFLPLLLAVWGTWRLARRNRRVGLSSPLERATADAAVSGDSGTTAQAKTPKAEAHEAPAPQARGSEGGKRA